MMWITAVLAAMPTTGPTRAFHAEVLATCDVAKWDVYDYQLENGRVVDLTGSTPAEKACVQNVAAGFTFNEDAERFVGWFQDSPSVRGHLGRKVVGDVIRAGMEGVDTCYATTLKSEPTLTGRMMTKLHINSEGQVTRAKLKSSDLENEKLEGCVLETLGELTFPKPTKDGSTTVTYPFAFRPHS